MHLNKRNIQLYLVLGLFGGGLGLVVGSYVAAKMDDSDIVEVVDPKESSPQDINEELTCFPNADTIDMVSGVQHGPDVDYRSYFNKKPSMEEVSQWAKEHPEIARAKTGDVFEIVDEDTFASPPEGYVRRTIEYSEVLNQAREFPYPKDGDNGSLAPIEKLIGDKAPFMFGTNPDIPPDTLYVLRRDELVIYAVLLIDDTELDEMEDEPQKAPGGMRTTGLDTKFDHGPR